MGEPTVNGCTDTPSAHRFSIQYLIERLVLRSDWRAVVFLVLLGLLLHMPGLGQLEFFRHTEADRTLIAWEMLERQDYVVPHLLGSPILTKPPLYYWVLAAVIKFTGRFDEFALRCPSAIAATLLAVVLFFSARLSQISRPRALLMALILLTSLLYMTLAVAAEIDMVFCLLSSSALLGLFLATERRSVVGVCLSWFLCALAFLAKGPPVLAFLAVAVLILAFEHRRQDNFFPWLLKAHLLGLLCFLAPISGWLSQVIASQGAEQLFDSFKTEIVERVIAKPRKEKSFFFYLPNVVTGLLPWSLVAMLGFISLLTKSGRGKIAWVRRSGWCESDGEKRFFRFCTALAIILLVLFSFARGKTPRYLFPAYPFFVPLFLLGILLSRELFLNARAAMVLRVLSIIIAASAIVVLLIPLAGVDLTARVLSILIGLSFAYALFVSATKRDVFGLCFSLLLLVATIRVGENTLYAQHRNATRSVKSQVAAIEQLVPASQPIYTIEMFERWVVYYLKRDGYTVKRLTDQVIGGDLPERVYLLLSTDDEEWRAQHLRRYDATAAVIGKFASGTTNTYLLEVASSALAYVKPRRFIPTIPSEPFYPDTEIDGPG